MKKLLLFLCACFCLIHVQAAYLRDVPQTLTQPDGTILHCFASGDEFFNYLHDKDGYTIMQHPKTGYYVYAEKRDGKLVATNFVAGKYDPASKGLQPYALISPEEWIARRKAWEVEDPRPKNRDIVPNHGTLNNIAIFIRFSDDTGFTNTFSSIDNMFNDMNGSYGTSMRSYFRAASYGAIDIPTTFYPGHDGETIISYQDTEPRSYFQPYNEVTNPNGYQNNDERKSREFSLLERAVNYVNQNYPVPTDLDIDYDNDGYVDNVCFIAKSSIGEQESILWPHKWVLSDKTVTINGKRVYNYNFHLAGAKDIGYFNTSTLCHEMNHSLGAPDLYHYYNGKDLNPVGKWDLMEYNATPPQHCGAYMKMKYGHWIDEIPEITQAGTYTLNPISSATSENVAYKIATEDPNQFYVLEYRKKDPESALYGSGILIYRIDTRFDGNASYNPNEGIYDELYLYRPFDGSANGDIKNAYFSSSAGRTEFNSSTNPSPFFTDGTVDFSMKIYDIGEAGNTISFTFAKASCLPPTNLQCTAQSGSVTLTWNAVENASYYKIYRDGEPIGTATSSTYTDANLSNGAYLYYVKSVDGNDLYSTASNMAGITLGTASLSSLALGTNDKMTITEGSTLTVTGTLNNDNPANLILEDGAQLIHYTSGVKATMQKNITAYTVGQSQGNTKTDGWHLIGSPSTENLVPSEDNGFLTNNYDLYFYDEPTHYWRNHKPNGQYANFNIEPLNGYLYANNTDVTLNLMGTLRIASETVTFPLSYTEDNQHAGFNLVGNPFAHNVTSFTGSNVTTDVYRMNDLKNEVTVSSISADAPLLPAEGFFVKATGDDANITFNSSAKGENVKHGHIAMEINENGFIVDRFIVKNEGEPLEKFTLNENSTKIFATRDQQDWAVVTMEGDEQAVNFKAAKNGIYTLTVSATLNSQLSTLNYNYLHLIDNMTGANIDLLTTPSYTFEAKTSDYPSRFKLVFSNCEDAVGDNGDAPFAFINNGQIIITTDVDEATLQVIDMLGHVILTHTVSSHSSLPTSNSSLNTPHSLGIYVLRLITTDGVRTQKIVVE